MSRPHQPGQAHFHVIVLPGHTAQFHWAKSGEYITQLYGIGPLGLEYLNRRDDRRNTS
jgi:hypothetical protein